MGLRPESCSMQFLASLTRLHWPRTHHLDQGWSVTCHPLHHGCTATLRSLPLQPVPGKIPSVCFGIQRSLFHWFSKLLHERVIVSRQGGGSSGEKEQEVFVTTGRSSEHYEVHRRMAPTIPPSHQEAQVYVWVCAHAEGGVLSTTSRQWKSSLGLSCKTESPAGRAEPKVPYIAPLVSPPPQKPASQGAGDLQQEIWEAGGPSSGHLGLLLILHFQYL